MFKTVPDSWRNIFGNRCGMIPRVERSNFNRPRMGHQLLQIWPEIPMKNVVVTCYFYGIKMDKIHSIDGVLLVLIPGISRHNGGK